MRTQKNISIHCPVCSVFSLMPIVGKEKKDGKVLYTVKCHKCDIIFQSGKPLNFWRILRKETDTSKEDVRKLQLEILETVIHGETPLINDTGGIIFVNNKPILKRKK